MKKYNSVQLRVIANGWEVDATGSYRIRADDACLAENTFVFTSFKELTEWLRKNLVPLEQRE